VWGTVECRVEEKKNRRRLFREYNKVHSAGYKD
jgi:hypothetical protein